MVFAWLLLLIPLSLGLHYFLHLGPLWTFATAIFAVVPLAEWIRRATEELAHAPDRRGSKACSCSLSMSSSAWRSFS